MKDYVVEKITTKSGALREIHSMVLGSRCYILELRCGERGFLKYEPRNELGNFHRLMTSKVISLDESDDKNELVIETENSTYYLRAIESLSRFYENIDTWSIRMSDAMSDVIQYLTCQNEEYFEVRDTTREQTLSNDDLMNELAREHYICVNQFGNDRRWSCKDACDNDPGIIPDI